ncbi:MAG: hypothetical protein JSS75_13100 [Bacteroidetes bacterium]|nr:hypothetical protein [Bacteroidota bacterium]
MIIAVEIEGEILSSHRARAASTTRIERLWSNATYAKMRSMSRYLRREKFALALSDKPKSDVELAFKPEDEESYFLASQLKWALEKASSNIVRVRPIDESETDPRYVDPSSPICSRIGVGFGGIVLRTREGGEPFV